MKKLKGRVVKFYRIYKQKFKSCRNGIRQNSVPYADKVVTEITCHAKGVYFLMPKDLTIIDIGGRDTKIIISQNGKVIVL